MGGGRDAAALFLYANMRFLWRMGCVYVACVGMRFMQQLRELNSSYFEFLY